EKETVRVWEPAWASAGDSLISGHARPTELAFSPEGRWLAVGGWDGSENGKPIVRLTDRRSGAVRDLPAPDREGYRLVYPPDGKHLTAVARKAAVVWETATGQETARLAAPAGGEFVSAAFDAAGELLIVDDAGGVWNVRVGQRIWNLPPNAGSAR